MSIIQSMIHDIYKNNSNIDAGLAQTGKAFNTLEDNLLIGDVNNIIEFLKEVSSKTINKDIKSLGYLILNFQNTDDYISLTSNKDFNYLYLLFSLYGHFDSDIIELVTIIDNSYFMDNRDVLMALEGFELSEIESHNDLSLVLLNLLAMYITKLSYTIDEFIYQYDIYSSFKLQNKLGMLKFGMQKYLIKKNLDTKKDIIDEIDKDLNDNPINIKFIFKHIRGLFYNFSYILICYIINDYILNPKNIPKSNLELMNKINNITRNRYVFITSTILEELELENE